MGSLAVVMNAAGQRERHALRHMRTEPPDSGTRPACRLCENLWGQCGIAGWSARQIAQAYEHQVPASREGIAAMREAIGALERAGQVVTFSYTGCQGELFACPIWDGPA